MSTGEPTGPVPRSRTSLRLQRLWWNGLPVWAVASVGVALGLGLFTFGYGGGASYLSDSPTACINCHVMNGHFDSWQGSSHRHVAVCNDCHLSPHPVGKWLTKADNGLLHSLAFTTGIFPEPIRIKPRNRRVTQAACMSCHQDFVHAAWHPDDQDSSVLCIHCHRSAGHGLR